MITTIVSGGPTLVYSTLGAAHMQEVAESTGSVEVAAIRAYDALTVDLGGMPTERVVERIPHDVSRFRPGENIGYMSCSLSLTIDVVNCAARTITAKVNSIDDDTGLSHVATS